MAQRFAMSSNTNAGQYVQAAKSAADAQSQIHATYRKYSPDYSGLLKAAAKNKSAEKIGAMEVSGQIAKAGIKAASDVSRASIGVAGKLASITAESKAYVDATKTAANASVISGFMNRAFSGGGGRKNVGLRKPTYQDRASGYLSLLQRPGAAGAGGSGAVGGGGGVSLSNVDAGVNIPEGGVVKPGVGSSSPSSSSGTPGDPSSTGMKLMKSLVDEGYTPEAAASAVGNAAYESADFTAHEEFEPNAHGTKGIGYFQWTGGRRTEFENFAKTNNLDIKSHDASSAFMKHELKHGKHWSGGMTTDQFKQMKDVQAATMSFRQNYLRPDPKVANDSKRLANANKFLNQYNSMMSQSQGVGPQAGQAFKVGSTGASTGPHLDFRVKNSTGGYENPSRFMNALSINGEAYDPKKHPISSHFGMREHPVYGGQRMHNGVDLALASGTEIKVNGGRFTGSRTPDQTGGGGYVHDYEIERDGQKYTVSLLHGLAPGQ